jgi:crotonobetainyl-CoA:carnitine CoA-transferase CaiB-like acyl-CoA transferase
MVSSPLSGLRIVEMAEALAGPFCSMLLGDLGADVIKVERPEVGDQSRGWGPPFLEGESAYYLSVNRNKRSIELDIRSRPDLELLQTLIDRADVFVTNIPRIESLERAGIDPPTARSRNPRLVYAAISGYGHFGPKAGRPGYDLIAQGEAGSMALTGEPDGGPLRFPTPMADISAGIYTALGILTALYARDRCGGSSRGQFIDVSLVDSQVTWLANVAGSWFATGERPRRMGNLHPSITPYQPMMTRDKMIIVAVGTERLWRRFCEVLEIETSFMEDPRFATNRLRNQHRPELVALLESILETRSGDEWVEALVAAGVPAGPVNFPDEILGDEHLRQRRMIVELEHPLIGMVRSIGCPVHLSEAPPVYRRHPPRLGEHNDEIRAELERADS